jgi:hypothetical protein
MKATAVKSVNKLPFIDNSAIKGREESFSTREVMVAPVIKSWRNTLFSYEWLDEQGHIRAPEHMPEKEQLKRQEVEEQLKNNCLLSRPVIGLGLNDDVEIGAGRAVFLTLAAHGHEQLPVHIPRSCLEFFEKYLA